MDISKAKLRRRLKKHRLKVPGSEVREASRKIAERAAGLEFWRTAKHAHIYQSVPAWHEVDTAPLIIAIRKNWPRIKIDSPEPKLNSPLPIELYDIIVAPILGFDKNMHRLGLGGGWYDRFLATQPGALKIGLSYGGALVEPGWPIEPHDIALDIIVTETDIIKR